MQNYKTFKYFSALNKRGVNNLQLALEITHTIPLTISLRAVATINTNHRNIWQFQKEVNGQIVKYTSNSNVINNITKYKCCNANTIE